MIKVLDKTLKILETVAVASPRPIQPTVIADSLGINRPTCSRILKELCDAGYLSHVENRSGYTVGPRAQTFANTVRYKDQFYSRVRPTVEACATELKQSVLLAERKDSQRYILLHVNRNPHLHIVLKQIAFNDLFFTATGIILLAYAPKAEQLALYDLYKKERREIFDEFCNCGDLTEKLAGIREKGIYIREKYPTSQGIAAVPVFRNGCFAAALGVSCPSEDFSGSMKKKITAAIKRTADRISSELTEIETIG